MIQLECTSLAKMYLYRRRGVDYQKVQGRLEVNSCIIPHGRVRWKPERTKIALPIYFLQRCKMTNNKISPQHYSKYKIQPIDFILANDLDFAQGNIIKYVLRYKDKNGLEDLQKAKQNIDFLIKKLGDSNE